MHRACQEPDPALASASLAAVRLPPRRQDLRECNQTTEVDAAVRAKGRSRHSAGSSRVTFASLP
jgi:hypothetical protein